MKTNRIAGLALLVGSLAACRLVAQPAGPIVQATQAGSLMTCSLQKGTSSNGGTNHNPTGMAYYHGSGQRIDRVEIRGDFADFGTGDAVLGRVLRVTHSELLITGVLQNEPDGQLSLVGLVLFDGHRYPFCQPAEVAVQCNQQVIECIINLVSVSTPKKFDWLWRAKPRLRVGFMATFMVPPAPGSLTLN
ncbi:hypothetical protein [Spirosoma arcticum]